MPIKSRPLNVSPGKFKFRIPQAQRVPGEVTDVELMVLCWLTALLGPTSVFEIGTYRGRTTLGFAMNMTSEGVVYTLDLGGLPKGYLDDRDRDLILPQHEVGTMYRAYRGRTARVVQLWGDSREFDFTPYTQAMDLVFVDGAHDYGTALSDLRAAVVMTHDEGIIVCHDAVGWEPEVQRAVAEFIGETGLPGVHIEGTTLNLFGKIVVEGLACYLR